MNRLLFAALLALANTHDATITRAAVSCVPGNIQIAAHADYAYNLMIARPGVTGVEIGYTEFPSHNKVEWNLPFTLSGEYTFGLLRFDKSQPDITVFCTLP